MEWDAKQSFSSKETCFSSKETKQGLWSETELLSPSYSIQWISHYPKPFGLSSNSVLTNGNVLHLSNLFPNPNHTIQPQHATMNPLRLQITTKVNFMYSHHHTYIYLPTYLPTYIDTCLHTYRHIYTYIHTYIHTYTRTHTHKYARITHFKFRLKIPQFKYMTFMCQHHIHGLCITVEHYLK